MPPSFRQLFLDFAAIRRQSFAACKDSSGFSAALLYAQKTSSQGLESGVPKGLLQALDRLLQWPGASADKVTLTQALLDPYFPAEMIQGTIFSHVTGMRFYIDKDRPEMQPLLLRDLTRFAEAFLEIRHDLARLPSFASLLLSTDSRPHPVPSGQWCHMCGTCCEIGGVPAVAPPGVTYPSHWRALLEGTRLDNQQLCPFLFQSPGSKHHFCSIHPIKPLPCQAFDAEDCRARRRNGSLHQSIFDPSPSTLTPSNSLAAPTIPRSFTDTGF
ncbi:MAG: hypothetical protein WHS46_07765 [Desulfosoma sp.]